jgi:hypothetical protein
MITAIVTLALTEIEPICALLVTHAPSRTKTVAIDRAQHRIADNFLENWKDVESPGEIIVT